jgi:hypothetical protein
MASSAGSASTLHELVRTLGDRADMLDYLPFNSVTFQEQYEIPLAIPKAILFGTLKRKAIQGGKPLVWIYLCRKSPSLVFHSYYPNGKPDGILINDEVIPKAVPHDAFQFATDPMRLLVLSLFYFLKEGVETSYEITMTRPYEVVLLSICEDLRRAREGLPPHAERSMMVKLRVRVPPHMLKTVEEHMNEANKEHPQGSECADDSGIQTNHALFKPLECAAHDLKDVQVCLSRDIVVTTAD